jgi:hypothetical protein
MPNNQTRVREDTIEYEFIDKLKTLKYEYRTDIHDRAALERNFREKFEALNRVRLISSISSSQPRSNNSYPSRSTNQV